MAISLKQADRGEAADELVCRSPSSLAYVQLYVGAVIAATIAATTELTTAVPLTEA